MAKRDIRAYWGSKSDRPASLAVLDPLMRLGFAVVDQAVKDLKEADPLRSLPALCWWLQDGPDWLAMLDLCNPDDGRYFMRLLESGKNGKKATCRSAKR